MAPAFDVLRTYLEARAEFSAADVETVRAAFVYKRLPAGGFLQRAGDVPRCAAFVASGCLRNYVIDAKGKEHIVQFAPETWWLADGIAPYAAAFRTGLQRHAAAKDQRIVSALSGTAEERYREFLQTYPSI